MAYIKEENKEYRPSGQKKEKNNHERNVYQQLNFNQQLKKLSSYCT